MEECQKTLKAFNFTKSNTSPLVFFKFLKLGKWYQIVESIKFNCLKHIAIYSP